MAAATPIPAPTGVIHPLNFRPRDYPDAIEQVWDTAVMQLGEDVSIPISRDCFADDIGVSTLVEVHLGKTIRAQPSAPVTMWLKSTNATDKQPITITYLDSNKDYQQSIFMLNGTTPVELPLMYRCLGIENASSTAIGTYLTSLGVVGFNIATIAGAVSVYYGAGTGLSTENTTLQYFPASYAIDSNIVINKSMDSSFTIPRGWTGYAFGFEAVNGKNDEVFLNIETRAPGGPWVSRVPISFYENIFTRIAKTRAIPELYDLRILAKSGGVAADVPIGFNYQLALIKNAT